MTDLLSEELISLTKLAQELEKHVSSIWRWRQRGIRGVRLECISIGGQCYTTREAFSRFVAASNGDRPPASRTPRQRLLEFSAAERELNALLGPTKKVRRRRCG